MSSRAPLAALLAASVAGAPWAAACNGDDEPRSEDADADRAAPEANRPAPAEGDATPSCREQCAADHATSLAKDEAIRSCWEDRCAKPCLEAAPDGGDGEDAGACVSPVVTVSEACDVCTRAACCAPWDACFQDPDCAALNACYQTCAE